MAAVSNPTVPAPSTKAVEPGAGLARLTACIPTERGSRRAAASKEILSGSLQAVSIVVATQNPEISLLVTPDGRVIDPFLESTLVVGDRFRTTPESHLLAKVITTFTTDGALATSHPNFKSYPVTDVKARDLGPYGNDNARGLMAQ